MTVAAGPRRTVARELEEVPVDADVLIRGGTVVDGTGAPARTADVAISGDRIVAVGRFDGDAREVVDADGALVLPGFVDIHTHYDGQATWDSRLQPSSLHGVTTAVMGNCGVGFAPVLPTDQDQLIELMEGVEDIPGTALHAGLPWTWSTFAEYLDAVGTLPHDIDVAAQVGHAALRLQVMGQRGADREPAAPEEIEAMGRLAAEAIGAGALGFTTSRTINHRTSRGAPTPTLTASRDELVGIAAAIGRTGTGVLQLVSDLFEFDAEVETFLEMMRASGRPLSVSLAQGAPGVGYRKLLRALDAAAEEGLTMRAQVAARPIGVLLGLEGSVNPLGRCPTYEPLHALPLPDRVTALGDPAIRSAIVAEWDEGRGPSRWPVERLFVLDEAFDYEPPPSASIAGRAAAEGRPAGEVLYDALLADEGRAFVYLPFANYHDGNLDAVAEMLGHPRTVPGLSDGGAHVGTICDASFPTTLLAHWGRDRAEGFEIPFLVHRQCRATAEAVGLLDRGVLVPGYKADVIVVDLDHLSTGRPMMAHDLPAGGKRLLQPATGYLHTYVSGVETYADGEATGALPGVLVRGAQSAPASTTPTPPGGPA
jgi:N-acyl-D-aspartate/D-glutamate deacylase